VALHAVADLGIFEGARRRKVQQKFIFMGVLAIKQIYRAEVTERKLQSGDSNKT